MRFDSLTATHPDSALRLLIVGHASERDNGVVGHASQRDNGVVGHASRRDNFSMSHRQLMRLELLRARAMNKAYVDFTTDSVMKEVAAYYDRHGTPNEQMEAHYLLGCAYRDMGEAPRAVDCFLDAVAKADTTATDCNFYLLSCGYAQMASVYYQQQLFSHSVEARKRSIHYTLIAGDTIQAFSDKTFLAGAYILMNRKDTAETILQDVICYYQEHGLAQKGITTSLMLLYLYSDNIQKISEQKRLIDRFDADCMLFDKKHDLPSSSRIFFYYKGKYFENTGRPDSAEHYYRKVYYPNMPFTARNSMYKGLLSIFKTHGKADSIAKYAQLYCAANDSSVAVKDKELTAQIAASYQYNTILKELQINERKAYQANVHLIILLVLFLVAVLFAAFIVNRNRKKRKQQQLAYTAAITERAKLKEELANLVGKNYDAIIAQKEDEIESLNDVIAKHETVYRQVMSKDRLVDFVNSDIVRLFDKGKEFRKDAPELTNAEWEELVWEFSKDMPTTYAVMNVLSPLQLHVCILLLLDYEETVIAILKHTKPQTINNAKIRANKKLFNSNDSASLKPNLKRLVSV
jgi:hypothetical protein